MCRRLASSLLLLALGCSRSPEPGVPIPIAPTEVRVAPLDGPWCAGVPTRLLASDAVRVLGLQPVYSGGQSVSEVAGTVEALAAYLARYGVQVRAAAPRPTPMGSLVAASYAGVAKALRSQGLELGSAAGDAAVADRLYGPLRRLLYRWSVPARPELVLVLLDHITAPGSAAAGLGPLVGLGLSPALAASAASDDPSLIAMLGLPPEFTPTIIMSRAVLTPLSPRDRRLAAAHELAHALGDGHSSHLGPQGSTGCVPPLSPAALQRLLRLTDPAQS